MLSSHPSFEPTPDIFDFYKKNKDYGKIKELALSPNAPPFFKTVQKSLVELIDDQKYGAVDCLVDACVSLENKTFTSSISSS